MSHTIFLDESGDLGFKFDKPYMKGGSSRHLTIASIIVPNTKLHLLKRVVKRTYEKYGFVPGTEVKASDLNVPQKEYVARQLKTLTENNDEIKLIYITVKKNKVQPHIQKDPNKLYNYMMKLSILDEITGHQEVILIRDNRSVKVASGNSLIDYLQTVIYFEKNTNTKLKDKPSDSKKYLNLILTDWLNNIVWNHYEFKNSTPYNICRENIKSSKLFF